MPDHSIRAVQLLIDEAWSYYRAARYHDALRAAERAVAAARELGDLGSEVRAVSVEAAALQMLGDKAAAQNRYTWMLSLAQNRSRAAELEQAQVTEQIAKAYMGWVVCARFLPGMEVSQLFAVLDAGEAYLRAVGRGGWRAGLLAERARLLQTLDRPEEAVPLAEEAVALKERTPDAPGYTLATYRWSLGDLLLELGRHAEAARQYEAVLADPGSNPHGQKVAHEGLGRCALAASDPAAARRHAGEAVQLAEGMGDDSLCNALNLLLDVCLAAPDLVAAREAAERQLAAARRTGSSLRLYFALRDAARVALAEAEADPARRSELLGQARAQLDEAEPIARLMDRSEGRDRFASEIARWRKQLAELEGGAGEEKSE